MTHNFPSGLEKFVGSREAHVGNMNVLNYVDWVKKLNKTYLNFRIHEKFLETNVTANITTFH